MCLRGILSSVLFGPQRVSKTMLAVSEALYGRTEWKGHGPLGQPKGVIAVLGDRPAGLTLPGPSEPHTSSKPRPPAADGPRLDLSEAREPMST